MALESPEVGEGARTDDAPTEVEGIALPAERPSLAPSAPRPSATLPPEASGGGSTGTSLVTARETLGLQEVHRTRTFLRVTLALAAVQGLALTVLGGDPTARVVLAGMLVLVAIAAGTYAWIIRDELRYSVGTALVVGFTTIATVIAAIWYYGVFSPAAVVIPLGLYFFCLGQDARASVAVYATCALGYAGLAGALMAGARDPGLVTAESLTQVQRTVILLVVEVVLLTVFFMARATRAATLYAIERHDVVVRGLAMRDALLKEARQEIAHAMRVGGVGRYTGELIGPFRLGKLIGRGAMGEVYEGTHEQTKDEVAVKLVHPQLLAEPDVVERFFREAQITSALAVANVVRVVEVGDPNASLPFIAMERLFGQDLADMLRAQKRLAIGRVLTMLRQVGLGVDAAHAAGVVHRDLKPRNLFCARAAGRKGGGEVWKVLDFGVSKLDRGDGTLTRGQIVGTPAYMAPEQARAQQGVDKRADIFALGVIVYRALTGSPPFWGDTSVEILFKVSHSMPAQPSSLVSLRPEVDLVLAIALAKSPADRFQSVAEMAQALDAAARGRITPELADRADRLLRALPWGAGA